MGSINPGTHTPYVLVLEFCTSAKNLFLLQKSDRAFLHTSSPMSWAEAEDFCQTMYGHLATDDSAGELRQVKYNLSFEYMNTLLEVCFTFRMFFSPPSSSLHVNLLVQSGLAFTNRAPRHSSRGREQNTMDLNIFQTKPSPDHN